MPFNFWDFSVNPEFVATFRGQYKSVGAFKKNVFWFRDETGKSIHVWGLVDINNQFYGLPFGTKVRLKFAGMKKMPDSERMFKSFELEVLEPPKDEEENAK